MLEADHKELRGVFDAFKKTKAGDGNLEEKKSLVQQMVLLLKVHTMLENEGFYPLARQQVPALEETVLESYEEHHVADVLCKELSAMSPADTRFDAKTSVLMDAVTRHMDEEEQDWFPKVRAAMSAEQLKAAGAVLTSLKAKAAEKV